MPLSEPLHHHFNDGKFHVDCERCKLERRLFANDLPERERKQLEEFIAVQARMNIARRARKVTVAYEPLHGNLVLTLHPSEAPRLRRLGRGHPGTCVAESAFIRDYLRPQGFREVKPEDVGALTSAPLVVDSRGEVFGFMGYQVQSFLEELIADRAVEWQRG
jgi:hypothetical protein